MTTSAGLPSSGSLPPPLEGSAPGPVGHRTRRALYRATHRGTKELDWLIGRYVEARLPGIALERLDLIERFLVQQDPDLHGWIMKPELAAPAEFAGIVAEIRAFHGMNI